LVSHSHSANLSLKLTVGTQNGELHVTPHDQILYVHDTTVCSR